MREVCIRAGAKINLGLDIVGRREDGYHLIRSVMQRLAFGDDIVVAREPIFDGGETLGNIHLKTEIAAGDDCYIRPEGAFSELKDDETNLAYRAARMICDDRNVTDDVYIRILKRNPMGAGVAGGSADAAAVAEGIHRLFVLNMGDAEKLPYGERLGADVPFCMTGGTALCEGIGERITRLPGNDGIGVVLIKPEEGIDTGFLYRRCDELEKPEKIRIDELVRACRTKRFERICDNLGNIMELPATEVCPEIAELKRLLLESGARGACMTGSGSAVFGLYKNAWESANAFERLSGAIRLGWTMLQTVTA